jgi:signal transduction histidine kinase
VWNFRDITDRVKSHQALREHRERLRAMALDLALGEERERRRIAAGLHDQIGQTLALLCVRMERLVEAAGTSDLGDQCREILAATRRALGMTRSLTFELSPPVLYEFGLVPAVKWLGHELQQQCGITFTVETTVEFESPEEDVAILLFQTIRELLTNVVKHSKARKCHTAFSPEEHRLVITVQDDGVGFDADVAHLHRTTHGSFGLFSIQERLKGLGGDMAIESKPDHGSLVKLWIPRKHGSADDKEGAK